MPITDTFSPVLHRIDQAVRWRAVNPTEPIPPPYEILTRYSQPPKDLVAQSKRKLEKLMAAANVKKGMFPHLCVFGGALTHSEQYHRKYKDGGVIAMKSNRCPVLTSRHCWVATRERRRFLLKMLFQSSAKLSILLTRSTASERQLSSWVQ